MTQQPQFAPEHVHVTKKVIAWRLGTSPRRVSEMMQWDDPLPVEYDQVTEQWVVTEEALAAWSARHRLSSQEAQRQGVVRGRGRSAGRASAG